jgi:catechol 2,3-dioxygenase-like lactoylglutathione lyase family enzyme
LVGPGKNIECRKGGFGMIKAKEYNHVGIVVRDLEKCKWFYGEVLGLTTIPRPPFNFPGHWYQVGPRSQLHLMVYEETIPDTMRHIALEVVNFEETVQELRGKRIGLIEGPGKRPDGSDYLFCKDPDGNRVEITRH